VYGSILIVDPIPSTCALLYEALTQDGFVVDVAAGPGSVQTGESYDVVVAGVGLECLPELRARVPGSQVVLLTSAERTDETMLALQMGVFDVVTRPFYVEDVSLSVACAAARARGPLPTNPLHLLLKNCEVTR
jgi:DNA-binding response OmpR family regulator